MINEEQIEQLIDKVEEKPEVVKEELMTSLKMVIKMMKATGKSPSEEQELYKWMRDTDVSENTEEFQERLQEWFDNRSDIF